ncbi:MAG: DMT family transporter [Alphaproteobacteria bacterium]
MSDPGAPESGRTGKCIAIFVLAMIIFAFQDAITKHLSVGFPAPQLLLIRFSVFLITALAFTVRGDGIRAAFATRCLWLQILRTLVIVAEIGLFILSVRTLPLADAHAIIAVSPLIVTALSVLLLHEQVGLRRWAAVVVGFIGILIILRPSFQAVDIGMLYALGTAVLFALYMVLTRIVSLKDSAGTSMIYMGVVGVIATGVLAPFYWRAPDLQSWGLLLGLGVLSTIAHLFLLKALSMTQASVLQPFNYTLLVWVTVVGFVVFGDFPDAWTIAGAGIVVASGLYTIYRERARASQP